MRNVITNKKTTDTRHSEQGGRNSAINKCILEQVSSQLLF